MVSAVVDIDFNEPAESIPAYLCMIAMPLLYSISEGIAVGVISDVVINIVVGKAKKIHPLMVPGSTLCAQVYLLIRLV